MTGVDEFSVILPCSALDSTQRGGKKLETIKMLSENELRRIEMKYRSVASSIHYHVIRASSWHLRRTFSQRSTGAVAVSHVVSLEAKGNMLEELFTSENYDCAWLDVRMISSLALYYYQLFDQHFESSVVQERVLGDLVENAMFTCWS
ncbi:hypothetical protein PoB_005912100 [Plakobranchus ocellatus]|uniref:Uncharacterized protein n=1 Tax=Plakobranchus ocellatus TaxID=259542 RepID=A0AAV4CIB9_9GAST|nr:hypothetical protein PoB_005912100 [Plakobranchus ocellatus]